MKFAYQSSRKAGYSIAASILYAVRYRLWGAGL